MSGFVATKSSMLKKDAAEDYESIKYESHKSKKKPNLKRHAADEVPVAKSVDLKKLRYEVIKFGTSGMDSTRKEESSIALAVALGAKPPKNKYKNYKEILASKREEKEKEGVGNAIRKGDEKVVQPSHRHLYVVGSKVIPAKPKSKDGVKNFLESYGKPGKAKIGRGSKRKS